MTTSFGAETHKCTGLGGWLFGHEYQPRYSYGPPNFTAGTIEVTTSGLVALVEASKERAYHHDICTRCGHIVNKQPL